MSVFIARADAAQARPVKLSMLKWCAQPKHLVICMNLATINGLPWAAYCQHG